MALLTKFGIHCSRVVDIIESYTQERRAKEKSGKSKGVEGGEGGPDSLNTSGEIQGIEWGEETDEDEEVRKTDDADFDDFEVDAPNRKKISSSAAAGASNINERCVGSYC